MNDVSTADVALVIAAISLAWNVVATLVGWRGARPSVHLELGGPFASLLEDDYSSVVARKFSAINHGGRSVVITEFGVISSTGRGEILYHSVDDNPFRPAKGRAWFHGPEVPSPIEPSHSVTWRLDLVELFRGTNFEGPPYEMQVYVGLSTGERLWKSLPIGEWEWNQVKQDLEDELKAGRLRSDAMLLRPYEPGPRWLAPRRAIERLVRRRELRRNWQHSEM